MSSNVVSQQDLDQRAADLGVKQAAVRAAEANVERLQSLAGYERVAAPFDGVVTARNTDVGALINAGSSAAAPMFVVSRPQAAAGLYQRAAELRALDHDWRDGGGHRAGISRPSFPGRGRGFGPFGRRRLRRDFDAARDRQRERRPDARRLRQRPLGVRRRARRIPRLPVGALIFDRHGLASPPSTLNNHVAMKAVTLARDLGAEVEIGSGLRADDRVVGSPPDGLADGDEVKVMAAAHKPEVATAPSDAK